jgi:hypothetical protein
MMILNIEQQQAVENGQPVTLNVAGTECILVRKDVYLRGELEMNSNPWTTEEMNLLADEAEAMISQKERHEP